MIKHSGVKQSCQQSFGQRTQQRLWMGWELNLSPPKNLKYDLITSLNLNDFIYSQLRIWHDQRVLSLYWSRLHFKEVRSQLCWLKQGGQSQCPGLCWVSVGTQGGGDGDTGVYQIVTVYYGLRSLWYLEHWINSIVRSCLGDYVNAIKIYKLCGS